MEKKELKVTWQQTEDISNEEAEERMNEAFDVLFRETIKEEVVRNENI